MKSCSGAHAAELADALRQQERREMREATQTFRYEEKVRARGSVRAWERAHNRLTHAVRAEAIKAARIMELIKSWEERERGPARVSCQPAP